MLRCRKCWEVVFDGLQEVTDESSEAACTNWHMDLETLPEWILTSVHMSLLTVGRLNCPNCGFLLGGFNFIHRSECPCGRHATVYLSKSRVDHDHEQNRFILQHEWPWPLPTNKSDSLQPATVLHTPLPDTGETSHVISHDRSSLSAALYAVDMEDEAASGAVSGFSSFSAARQMVQTEEDERSYAENPQEELSMPLSETPNTYSLAEQEEEMPGPWPSPATLRRQRKREKNRLRNQRRKQRRRQKWLQASILSALMLTDEEEEEGDKEGLTCVVCLDVYFRPHMCQPCSHIFCEPCLRRLARNQEENTPCPLCRTLILHAEFHPALNRTAEAAFPRLYLAREQYFQIDACLNWPLPGCRQLACHLCGGYWRYAERTHRSWDFALETLDLPGVSSWFFDVGLAIVYGFSSEWFLGLAFLCLVAMYYMCV
ncbi:E3 ubiquitin-protein ligase RNF180 [Festucalex cinctus]